nr:hypothetical protein [Tanacetum cinerariifolium]
ICDQQVVHLMVTKDYDASRWYKAPELDCCDTPIPKQQLEPIQLMKEDLPSRKGRLFSLRKACEVKAVADRDD